MHQHQICTRVSDTEKQELEDYAQLTGLSVAQLLKRGALFYSKWLVKQQELAVQ